jgi:hypothetical protein
MLSPSIVRVCFVVALLWDGETLFYRSINRFCGMLLRILSKKMRKICAYVYSVEFLGVDSFRVVSARLLGLSQGGDVGVV